MEATQPRSAAQAEPEDVGNPNWPGEVLLDTSTAAKRARLARLESDWIDSYARDGFQELEPDNLDSYARSHGYHECNADTRAYGPDPGGHQS